MTQPPTPAAATLTRKERKDLKVLATFTAVYCHAHHPAPKAPWAEATGQLAGLGLERCRLCESCRDFLAYAIARRINCPLDPKPTCKHCTIHCYRPGHRDQVRAIMRFSGRRLILRGRLDLLWHYLF